jgi:hypothetical protein
LSAVGEWSVNAGTLLARRSPIDIDCTRSRVKTITTPTLSACCIAMALLLFQQRPSYADEPCGRLVGANGPTDSDGGFVLRDGEAVDFVSGDRAAHGRLLVFSDGAVFRAYWQPQGSEEKYALANAGPDSVRLISTPPQGTPQHDGKPGIATRPLKVLSCPKL